MFFRNIISALVGFSGGIVIAGGIFAFIAIIGVIPRLIQKTKTNKYVILYENLVILGGILGSITMIWDVSLPIGKIGAIIIGFSFGIFVGCLAVSLAEILDVIPIMTRRFSIKTGIGFFLISTAIGKTIGALIYWIIPGFIQNK
ncbi:stage V sporulation protein AB [Defluviitalea phaphyphila]|uniref:stage V sporulation protein AB n=1 Tax=Defluviitalea phaphyphila TaxID=1473580 RepID=UPI000731BE1A|nr:stage V sporulation protein AB [Defluviitalea phaphyphila]